jgi:S-adenosylmethionine/arginine decarboxylase-like enzyme
LRELVPAIDMKAYGDPIVERFGDGDDVGISAVQLIYTSAITIHTNDMYRDMYLDVFSCKPFNAETVVERVRRAFAPAEVNHQLLYRR